MRQPVRQPQARRRYVPPVIAALSGCAARDFLAVADASVRSVSATKYWGVEQKCAVRRDRGLKTELCCP